MLGPERRARSAWTVPTASWAACFWLQQCPWTPPNVSHSPCLCLARSLARGWRAGLSGGMPSEPELGSTLSHFFWKPLGMLEPQQNASSSILCFGLRETNNRAASLLWSFFCFFPHHSWGLLSCQTGEGGGARGSVSGLRTERRSPLHFGFDPVG